MLLRVAALLAAVAAKLPWQNTDSHGTAHAPSRRPGRLAATYVPSKKNASFIPRTKASETWFSVVAATDAEELRLLPHLLKHYAWIPPSRFVVVLHAPKRTATYREMAHHVEAFGVMGHVHWARPTRARTKKK